jgi:hypothetical protein
VTVPDRSKHSDEYTEHCCSRHVARGRTQDQADPDAEHGIAEDSLHAAESPMKLADLIESAESVRRINFAVLRFVHQIVESGDLIERGEAARAIVSSSTTGSPVPIVTMRKVEAVTRIERAP